ncbi:hypothetical protein OK074_0576 [Actinobacteria bacterium OK074]|nr:hypothetical protein OK074_0576 [Actinobacteria bacterium OK074]
MLQFIGSDPLGGPAAVWIDTDTGDVLIKGLRALPEDVKGREIPGTDTVELPDRMRPILLQAYEAVRDLGLSPDSD